LGKNEERKEIGISELLAWLMKDEKAEEVKP
jgi:hypothetical protein